MKYSEDFNSKWGFGDGDSMPPDAHQVRTVNLFAANSLLAAVGSGYRLVPLDRAGMHNCWLWARRPVTDVAKLIKRVGLWDFCLGEWNSEKRFKIQEACWDDCDFNHEDNDPESEKWWLVMGACDGDGTVAGCDEDVGYAFVNARNQIRRKALEQWVRKVSKELVKR